MFLVGALLRFGSVAAWLVHFVACMGEEEMVMDNSTTFQMLENLNSGCLGCDTRPKLIPSLDEPLKEQNHWALKKSQVSQSEEFWTSNACDMDNSAVQSCASLSTQTHMHGSHGSCCSNTPLESVNHGLTLWNQTRQNWIGSKSPRNQSKQLREPRLSWNATYDSVLSNNKPFAKPIPLSEMIDFLVDIWEQEGLYD